MNLRRPPNEDTGTSEARAGEARHAEARAGRPRRRTGWPARRALSGPLAAGSGSASDPSLVQDVFFRIGGATARSATDSLVVNSSHVILDDIWAWRADHGAGAGYTGAAVDSTSPGPSYVVSYP